MSPGAGSGGQNAGTGGDVAARQVMRLPGRKLSLLLLWPLAGAAAAAAIAACAAADAAAAWASDSGCGRGRRRHLSSPCLHTNADPQ